MSTGLTYHPETDKQEHDRTSRTKKVMLWGWDGDNMQAIKVRIDPTGALAGADEQIKSVNSGDYTYFCFAQPGTAEATASWKIFRIDTDGNKLYADGDADYDNAASDPTLLTYSYT